MVSTKAEVVRNVDVETCSVSTVLSFGHGYLVFSFLTSSSCKLFLICSSSDSLSLNCKSLNCDIDGNRHPGYSCPWQRGVCIFPCIVMNVLHRKQASLLEQTTRGGSLEALSS